MDKVSVVVPIYNVEEYIKKCVGSLIEQTYRNIEVILVDDGSSDDSPRVCDEYAERYKRVRAIHKENGGLSDARNAGLRMATGKYIAFVDGDDYVESTYIQDLVECMQSEAGDMAVCAYYDDFAGKINANLTNDDKKIYTSVEAMKDIFSQNSILKIMTWNKLYARHLFENNEIEFPVGKYHEDNFTTYKLMYYAEKIVYLNKPLYYYVQRPNSIMTSVFSDKRLDVIQATEEAVQWVKDKIPQLSKQVYNYRFNVAVYLLHTALDDYKGSRRYHYRLVDLVQRTIKDTQGIGFKYKLLSKSLFFGPRPYWMFIKGKRFLRNQIG